MKHNKILIKEIFVTGFAMFAMFFGAGNLIFPPALGLLSGSKWFTAFLGFFVMDAGLAVLGILVVSRIDGNLDQFTEKLGKIAGTAVTLMMVLCIGPLVAIPRTAAVSYSMAVQPLLGSISRHPAVLPVFSVLFFAITLVLTIKPGKVVDIIGTYMTPILLFFLILMTILGIVNARLNVGEALVEDQIKEGVSNGYQTMDGMAAIMFAGILISSVREKHSGKECLTVLSRSSVLAALLLFIVYGGLTYLGAVWGQSMAHKFVAGRINQANLLTGIVRQILGNYGVLVIAIITLLACMTTAIGLTSASAQYFEKLSGHNISYKTFAVIICVVSAALCNIGLNEILQIASPILTILYPIIIVLMVMNVLSSKIPARLPTILGAAVAFLVGVMNVLCDTCRISAFGFIHKLPLDLYGVNFVIPAVLAILAGIAVTRHKA